MKIKTVVADASTLIGLSRIEQLNLLRKLYGEVIIPLEHGYNLASEGYDLDKVASMVCDIVQVEHSDRLEKNEGRFEYAFT